MPIKVTKEISIMDIGMGAGLVISALFYVFGIGAQVAAVEMKAETNAAEIQEVKDTHQRDKDTTYSELKEQRKEAKDQFEKVDGKLDKVMEILIQQNGNGNGN